MANNFATTSVDSITQTTGPDTLTITDSTQIQTTDFFDGNAGTDTIVISGTTGVGLDFTAMQTDAAHGFHNYEALTFNNTSNTSLVNFNVGQFGTGLISNALAVTGSSGFHQIFINN